MIDPRAALTQHFGPLPAWMWGVLGGGGLWLLRRHSAGTIAATNAQSGNLGLLPQPAAGALGSTPNSDTTGSVPTTTQETLGGLLGPLEKFLQGVPNAPNSFSLALPGGAAVGFSNGVPTFGNGIGLQPGPTVLNPGQVFVGGNPLWDFLGRFGIQPPGGGPPGGPTLPPAPTYTPPAPRIIGLPSTGVPNPLPPNTRGLQPSGQAPNPLPGLR